MQHGRGLFVRFFGSVTYDAAQHARILVQSLPCECFTGEDKLRGLPATYALQSKATGYTRTCQRFYNAPSPRANTMMPFASERCQSQGNKHVN